MSIPKINLPQVKPDKFRNFLSNYRNADAILPMILLESAVTSGRAIQANKRDGFTEMRERLSEDVFSAIFWLFSATAFNKVGDWIGEKVLKWPITEFDVGKDPLRTPFDNLHDDILKDNLEGEARKMLHGKNITREQLAGFKFGKIILSTAAAVSLIGFVFPKVNQAITKKVYKKNKNNDKPEGSKDSVKQNPNYVSMDDFKGKFDKQITPSFKGMADFMAVTAHGLENNTTYKLLATDVGIITGRATNARNDDERVEILFRDPASSFFYYAATPLTFLGLQKLPFAKLTKLDPNSAEYTHDSILLNMEEQLKGGMAGDDFRRGVFGKPLSEVSETLKKIPFENDVISLGKLKAHLPDELKDVALEMSKLQPQQRVNGEKISVLTKRQVQDVLSGGLLNEPKFLIGVYKNKFGKKLTEDYKFISMKDINTFRENIDDYINTAISLAKKKNDGKITTEFLENMCKRNRNYLTMFTGISFAISALFLSTIIPKTQYLITKLRTGKNDFPGTEGLDINLK